MSPGWVGRDGLTVVGSLERRRGGEAGAGFDLAVEASVVEPVDVGERRELDVVETSPWAFRVDQLPLVEPVERLDEGIVVAVALRADRRNDVVVGEPVGVANAEILHSAIAVMNQRARGRAPLTLRLNTAISSASIARSDRSDRMACQPTIIRENTSMMNAT